MNFKKKVIPEKTPEQKIKEFEDRRADLRSLLEKSKEGIEKLLPVNISPTRFVEVALSAITKKPELMNCTNTSILSSVMFCAELGLLPDSIIGEAYLTSSVIMNTNVCGAMVGYKGFCTLAMRSGQVESIHARAVYDGDAFDYDLGTNPFITHKRTGATDKTKITDFFAIVKLLNGGILLDVMPRDEVNQVRDNSKNYQNAPNKEETAWVVYFADMGTKTTLRRLFKLTPLSAELVKAASMDEAAEVGKQKIGNDYLDTSEEYKGEALKQMLEDNLQETNQFNKDSAAKINNKGAKAMEGTLSKIKANAKKKTFPAKSDK